MKLSVVMPLLDPEQLKTEWPCLKRMITGGYAKFDTGELYRGLLLLHKEIMTAFSILSVLCMQLTSVECEQSFSTQNRLKNKFHSSLG